MTRCLSASYKILPGGVKTRVLEITAEFEKHYDFGAVEIEINKELAKLGAALQQVLMSKLLVNVAFLL